MDSATQPLHLWALAAAYLFLKMFANTLVQGYSKFKSQYFALPEDAATFGKKGQVRTTTAEPELYKRASGCWRNDLENIPMFLFVALGYCFLDPNLEWCKYLLLAFCVARTLHTVFYLLKVQPWRNIAYQVGTIVNVIMTLTILQKVLFS